MSTTISPVAAKRINDAIHFKLYEANLNENKDAKQMCIGLAALVRRIVLEDGLPKEKP